MLQRQPFPSGRYCIALLILVGVTLILVITGIFSYRHLSSLRVSTLIVLENNSSTLVGKQSEGVKLTQLCLVVLLQQAPEDSLFHCRVVYEDSYNPLRLRQHELEENIGIYFEDNYEQISVPVPHFGGSDPADIIHDFHRVGDDISGFFAPQPDLIFA